MGQVIGVIFPLQERIGKEAGDLDPAHHIASVTISNEDGVWQYDIYAAYETALTAPVYQQGLSSPEEVPPEKRRRIIRIIEEAVECAKQ